MHLILCTTSIGKRTGNDAIKSTLRGPLMLGDQTAQALEEWR